MHLSEIFSKLSNSLNWSTTDEITNHNKQPTFWPTLCIKFYKIFMEFSTMFSAEFCSR